MKVLVQKFGGSSVKDTECMKRVAKVALREQEKGYSVVVVVSAMGDTTDRLVKLAGEISSKPNPREYDLLLSAGEQISIPLLAMAIQENGGKAISQTGLQVGIITEDIHGKARIKEIKTEKIEKSLKEGNIVVVAGFQGISELTGEVTTLGRGGSDTSAVALAAALNAERCDIYTDVPGILTTDPDDVNKTSLLKTISFEEMLELASLGAAVLHPRSVEIAKNNQLPLRVRSSFDIDNEGTLVQGVEKMELNNPVNGVALDESQARIAIVGLPDIPGIAAKLFGLLADKKISVDMIIQATSKDNVNEIAFTVDKDDVENTKLVADEFAKEVGAREVTVDSDISKVSIVGAGMIGRPGIAADMFKSLGKADINIKMISTSEIKVSCVVEAKDGVKAVQTLHDEFELENVGKATASS